MPLAYWTDEHGLGEMPELLVALADASAARHEAARRRARPEQLLQPMIDPPSD